MNHPVGDPKLFWDDWNLNGTTTDPSTTGTHFDYGGCTPPSATVGCHTWVDNEATHNTWFYIRRVERRNTFVMDNLNFEIGDNQASGVCVQNTGNKEFDDITFTILINPTKYDPATQLTYTTTINAPNTYTLDLLSTTFGTPYQDVNGLDRQEVQLTYRVNPTSPTEELNFNFEVTGDTRPDCPDLVSDDETVICDNILLPITLLDFNARHYSDNSVLVDWQTISEKDNKGFYVQRSINGKEFQDLTFVEGRGTTSNRVSYEFVDEEYWSGTAY